MVRVEESQFGLETASMLDLRISVSAHAPNLFPADAS
jgi:hypothetical protein